MQWMLLLATLWIRHSCQRLDRSDRSGQVLSCRSNRALFTILIFKLLGSFMLFYVIYCWNEVGSGTHVHIICNSKCHKAIDQGGWVPVRVCGWDVVQSRLVSAKVLSPRSWSWPPTPAGFTLFWIWLGILAITHCWAGANTNSLCLA